MKGQRDTIFALPPLSNPGGIVAAAATLLLLWLGLPGGGGLWPLLLFACVPLIVSVCRGSRGQAVFFALLCGVGHFLVLLYWIVFVLGHYGGLPLYLSVPALLLLSLYMAGYFVLFALFARAVVRHFSPPVSLWLLPCGWVALDLLRSFLFSGFPWMDLGYGLADAPILYQSADIWGHYGLTFLIVLFNGLFSLLLLHGVARGGLVRMVSPVALLLLVVACYSGWRWYQVDQLLPGTESMRVGVVQGNVDQGQKWNPARQGKTVTGYLEQSGQLMDGEPGAQLLVWPETALPFFPLEHPLLNPIGNFLKERRVMLLTGSPWYEMDDDQPENIHFFNASLLFDSGRDITATTAKSHLVPFGEYVPLKKFLFFLAPLVEAVGDFVPGEIANPPACQKSRIGVLICFESIFPDISRKWVDAGASLLVNITNDAWYGRSSAPHQTLAMTRLRAVETRRAIVRSANTGFSAFIDPLGRLQKLSPLFVPWAEAEDVAIMEGRSLFVRGGYLFAYACLAVSCFAAVLLWQRQRLSINRAVIK
ncbi:MAG: apolipoprotein N-acyltransferase [Thermodesulfobacteriota bacterium]